VNPVRSLESEARKERLYSELYTPDPGQSVGYRRKNGLATEQSGDCRTNSAQFENAFDFALEVNKIERLFNIAADSLHLEEGLHRRAETRQDDDRRFAYFGLKIDIIVTVGPQLPEIGQAILTTRNAHVHKNDIGFVSLGLLKTFGALVGGHHFITHRLKAGLDDPADIILIIDDEDTLPILRHTLPLAGPALYRQMREN